MKKFNRRRFLGMAAGAAGALSGAACGTSVDLGSNAAGPSVEDLDRAAATPIVDLSGLDRPVIIDSIRLLENDGEQFVHVRSKDGAEGL